MSRTPEDYFFNTSHCVSEWGVPRFVTLKPRRCTRLPEVSSLDTAPDLYSLFSLDLLLVAVFFLSRQFSTHHRESASRSLAVHFSFSFFLVTSCYPSRVFNKLQARNTNVMHDPLTTVVGCVCLVSRNLTKIFGSANHAVEMKLVVFSRVSITRDHHAIYRTPSGTVHITWAN